MVSAQDQIDHKISIIIPCYNQGEFLGDALDSVISQYYKNWECIIVNDGSIDNTELVAKQYVSKDNRIKYYKKENGGLSSARNFGLNNAIGDWIQFLDSDDYLVADKLSLSINEIIKTKTNDIVISNFELFKDNVENTIPPYAPLKPEYFSFENLLFGWNDKFIIPIHSGLFKRTLFDTYSFNELLKANEDWVMWLNILKDKRNISYLEGTYALYRVNPRSMTKDPVFVHDNIVIAYKHILSFIPEKYAVNFACAIIDRLNALIKQRENRITVLETTFKNKVIWKLKRMLNRN